MTESCSHAPPELWSSGRDHLAGHGMWLPPFVSWILKTASSQAPGHMCSRWGLCWARRRLLKKASIHSASSGQLEGPMTEATTAQIGLAGASPTVTLASRAWEIQRQPSFPCVAISTRPRSQRKASQRDTSLGSLLQQELKKARIPTSSAHRRAGKR